MNTKELFLLTQKLKQKEISLSSYEDFLRYQELFPFEPLTLSLKKKSVNLREYLHYLEQLPQKETTLSSAVSLSEEQRRLLKNIGLYLLKENRISLAELNATLQELSANSKTARHLLQHLLRKRKIYAEDFLLLEQKNLSPEELENQPYRVYLQSDNLQFYVDIQKGAKQLGRYQILGELGRGGMGAVYKAYHPQLQQIFALKVMLVGESASEKMLSRFHREIQTMAKMKHPGILQIVDSGQEGGQHYFAMEYVEGTTLAQYRKQRLPLRKSVSIIQKVLEALDYAHQQKIVHRDLKPENIFLTQEELPKIGDFGLAKDLASSAEEQRITRTGAILGTANYMAPEQARGEIQKIDARTDIYSVGVCLYELLTGRCPHQAPNLTQLLYQISQREPLPPSFFNPAIHRDLDTILLKALEKTRAKRYSSAKAFAEDLRCFLEGYPIHAKPANRTERLLKWSRRHRYQVLFFLVFLFVFAGTVGIFWLSRFRASHQQMEKWYQEAIQSQQRAEQVHEDTFWATSQKTKHLFYALNTLNQGLKTHKNSRPLQQKKWEIGTTLIQIACREKSYILADYLASEMQSLLLFSANERNALFEQIQTQQTQQAQFHQKQFEQWLKRLQQKHSPAVLKDAIFAIIKMPEPEIFEQLQTQAEKAQQYFLQEGTLFQEESFLFYEAIIKTLGRLGNKRAGKILWESLRKVKNQMAVVPVGARSYAKTQYMIWLAQAIADLKLKEYTEAFGEIRFEMAQDSLFWKRTQRAYRKLLQLQPQQKNESEKAPTSQKAFLLFAVEDFDSAIQELDRLIRLNPKDSDTYRNRGLAKRSKGDYSGAIQDYNRSLALNPESVATYNDRALCKKDLEDWDGALADFNQVLQLDAHFIKGYNNRGNLKRLQKDYQGAIHDFNRAIQLNAEYMEAYYNRGITFAELGDLAKAISDYQKTLHLNPQHFEAYNARGNALADLGKLQEALQDYEACLALNPRYAEAYNNRGLARHELQDYQGAIHDFTEALQLAPKMTKTYYNRGNSHYLSEAIEEAILDYNQALDQNPNLVEAYQNRGNAKQKKGDLQGAEEDFNATLRLQPEMTDAYFNRARLFQQQSRIKEALADYSQVIRLNPKDLVSWYNRAILKQSSHDLQGALKDYDEVLRLEPNLAEAYWQKSNIYASLGEIENALNDCQKALKLNPQLIEAYYTFGVILQLKGDLKQAKNAFKKFLQLISERQDPHLQSLKDSIFETFPELKK